MYNREGGSEGWVLVSGMDRIDCIGTLSLVEVRWSDIKISPESDSKQQPSRSLHYNLFCLSAM